WRAEQGAQARARRDGDRALPRGRATPPRRERQRTRGAAQAHARRDGPGTGVQALSPRPALDHRPPGHARGLARARAVTGATIRLSSPRRRGPIFQRTEFVARWVPAFAGTTPEDVACAEYSPGQRWSDPCPASSASITSFSASAISPARRNS